MLKTLQPKKGLKQQKFESEKTKQKQECIRTIKQQKKKKRYIFFFFALPGLHTT